MVWFIRDIQYSYVFWTNNYCELSGCCFFKKIHMMQVIWVWVMHFLQENGSLSQKCMKTDNYHDSIYLSHLINGFAAQTPCWCLAAHVHKNILCLQTRHSYLTCCDKISSQDVAVICENTKKKWVLIIWISFLQPDSSVCHSTCDWSVLFWCF